MGRAGQRKKSFQQGKRPAIIGASNSTIPLGAANFRAASRRELVFLPGNGLQKGRMWINVSRGSGSSGFPSPGNTSRSTKFSKQAAAHNTSLKTPQPTLPLSEIPSIVIF